jgi:hypothetical protein
MRRTEKSLVFTFFILGGGKKDLSQSIACQNGKRQPFRQLAAEKRLDHACQAADHYERELYLWLWQAVKALP